MKHLHIYLNDHLAGSVAALDLLDHLISTSKDAQWTAFFSTLRADIEADQSVLQNLLRRVGGDESVVRKAGAWLMEKIGRLKLQLMAENNAPGLHQALEGLALGITGKRALWRSLEAAEETVPELQGPDYEQLAARALEQRERVETQGLKVAPVALQAGPSANGNTVADF